MTFDELGLSDAVLKAVGAAGYNQPTPIQAQAIPHVLQRRDVLGIAQTGTGKTAAFTLPMLTLLEQGRARARMPRTLILEPTRELAAQVEENFTRYGAEHKLNVALLIGGVSFNDQDAKIVRGVDVLICTPGRLLDHFERGKLLLSGIEILVIDEADRMLDMGFIPDIERICKMVPFTRQTLFFTATMPPEIQRITEQFLTNPVKVEVAKPATTATTIKQLLVASGGKDFEKRETLRRILRGAENLKNAIIFCNRKRDISVVQRSLERHGFSVGSLHGDMDQRARMATLEAFRAGKLPLLVASDVAARGLDIPDVSHVINYDVPIHADDYVHRIGRTGRAGRTGTSYSIASRHDIKFLDAITALIGRDVEWDGPDLDSFVPAVTEDDGESPRRSRGSDRGHGREGRGERFGRPEGRGRRDGERSRAPRTPRGEASTEPYVHDPEAAAAAPARAPRREAAPAEARSSDAPARAPRRESAERERNRPRSGERPAPRAAEAGRGRRPADDEPSFVGLGDHVPSFLLRPVKLAAK
jgi:superfamily II DNA/RNA helicase